MKTKVVNIKNNSPYDIYIGRGSKWGNPFPMKTNSEQERVRVIKMYAEWIQLPEQQHLLDDLESLRGKTLGCFCAPLACHGNVLIALLKEEL